MSNVYRGLVGKPEGIRR